MATTSTAEGSSSKACKHFCAAHPEPAVLVTSRVRPYEQGHSRLDDLPAYTLEDLDDERIARFTLRWHEEIVRVGQSSSRRRSSLHASN